MGGGLQRGARGGGGGQVEREGGGEISVKFSFLTFLFIFLMISAASTTGKCYISFHSRGEGPNVRLV